jgi:hypothetical protein
MKKPFAFVFLGLLLSLAFVAGAVAVPSEVVLSGSLDMQAVSKTVTMPVALEFQAPTATVLSDNLFATPAVFAPPGSVSQDVYVTKAAQTTMTDFLVVILTAAMLGTAAFALRTKEVYRRIRDGLKRTLYEFKLNGNSIATAARQAAGTLRATA